MPARRAWIAYVAADPAFGFVVYAERRGQARHRASEAARRRGWHATAFVQFGSVRAPELDGQERAGLEVAPSRGHARVEAEVARRRAEGWIGCIPPANFLAPTP